MLKKNAERQLRTARLANATAALQTIDTKNKNKVNKTIIQRVIEDPTVKQNLRVVGPDRSAMLKTFIQKDPKFIPNPDWNSWGHYPSKRYENLLESTQKLTNPRGKNPAAISFIGKGLTSAFGAAINVAEIPLEGLVMFRQLQINMGQAILGTIGLGNGKWSDVWEDAYDNAKDLVPISGGHLFLDDIFVNEDWLQQEFTIPKLGWTLRYSQLLSIPMDFALDPLNYVGGVGIFTKLSRAAAHGSKSRAIVRNSVDELFDDAIEGGLQYANRGVEAVVGEADALAKASIKATITNKQREEITQKIITLAGEAGEVSKADIKTMLVEIFEEGTVNFRGSPTFSPDSSVFYNVNKDFAAPLIDRMVDVVDVFVKARTIRSFFFVYCRC